MVRTAATVLSSQSLRKQFDAIAAGIFGLVERGVSHTQQGLARVAVFRETRDTERGCDSNDGPAERESVLSHDCSYFVRSLDRFIAGHIGQHHQEFLSSVAAADVARPAVFLHQSRKVCRRTAELEQALRENERIERALRRSEATFRGVVSQSLVGIATIENGTFGYANSKFCEIFGYSPEE